VELAGKPFSSLYAIVMALSNYPVGFSARQDVLDTNADTLKGE
jgi:hypothetical protein